MQHFKQRQEVARSFPNNTIILLKCVVNYLYIYAGEKLCGTIIKSALNHNLISEVGQTGLHFQNQNQTKDVTN